MKCARVREELSALLDEELRPAVRSQVEAHLASCQACQQALTKLQRVDSLFRNAPAHLLPEGFEAGVRAAIQGRKSPKMKRLRLIWVAVPALAAAAVLVVAVFMNQYLLQEKGTQFTVASSPASKAIPEAVTAEENTTELADRALGGANTANDFAAPAEEAPQEPKELPPPPLPSAMPPPAPVPAPAPALKPEPKPKQEQMESIAYTQTRGAAKEAPDKATTENLSYFNKDEVPDSEVSAGLPGPISAERFKVAEPVSHAKDRLVLHGPDRIINDDSSALSSANDSDLDSSYRDSNEINKQEFRTVLPEIKPIEKTPGKAPAPADVKQTGQNKLSSTPASPPPPSPASPPAPASAQAGIAHNTMSMSHELPPGIPAPSTPAPVQNETVVEAKVSSGATFADASDKAKETTQKSAAGRSFTQAGGAWRQDGYKDESTTRVTRDSKAWRKLLKKYEKLSEISDLGDHVIFKLGEIWYELVAQ